MTELILASGSPRRKELLELAGIRFDIVKSGAAEIIIRQQPDEIVEELSFQKAQSVADEMKTAAALSVQSGNRAGRIVLGADTIVWADGRVLGKPKDREDARAMLELLQGKTHEVYTGVTLILDDERGRTADTFSCRTRVHVHAMTPEEIESYLDTGEPFDKAGAYGIQGRFAVFVDGIEGDYNNVVGLPISMVWQHLKRFGKEENCK